MTTPTTFYVNYPMMQPYVGDRYHGATTKLLLIGESHYLPLRSRQHLTASDWYGGTSATLTEEEKIWISTAPIIRGAVAENFRKKAHWIWKNAFKVINEAGPKYADYKLVAKDIAFFNFFLRPAKTGKSLGVTPDDVVIANDAFALHHSALRPTAVIFLSALAHANFKAPPAARGTKVVVTMHPSSAWWNRASKKRGNKSGRQILHDYIATTSWP